MIGTIAAACGGFVAGWLVGRLDRETQGAPRGRINHENTAPNSSEERPRKFAELLRLDPGRVQRGNGSGGPTTPKPPFIPPSLRLGSNPPPPGRKPGPPCNPPPLKP